MVLGGFQSEDLHQGMTARAEVAEPSRPLIRVDTDVPAGLPTAFTIRVPLYSAPRYLEELHRHCVLDSCVEVR